MDAEGLSILKKLVETKLSVSGALRNTKIGGIGSNPLDLSGADSLLIEFQGLRPESRYRMLISFMQVDLMEPGVQRKIGRCRECLHFDLAVFWSLKAFSSDQMYTLKNAGIHVISLRLDGYHGTPFQEIPDFIHVPGLSYDRLLKMNLAASELADRLRKKFHLVLSELAADSYDDYGTFATRQVMKYEDELLRDSLGKLLGENQKGHLAIDVGCGDGRHSRVLAKYFRSVIAVDLSRRMIDLARDKDRTRLAAEANAVEYHECDVEYEEFPGESEIIGSADFVCASFGMPSFIENTVSFMRRVYSWLKPGGQALFTFYNAQSLALGLETPWKDRSMSAKIDTARDALEVELSEGVRFSIYCKALDDRMLDVVRAVFNIEHEAYYPHVMSILPHSVFGSDEAPRKVAREEIPKIDRAISWGRGFSRGHYAFLIVEKGDSADEAFLRVIQALDDSGVKYRVLAHEEVVSTGDVQRLLDLPPAQMVKSVVFKNKSSQEFIVALAPAGRRVLTPALAEAVGAEAHDIVLAAPKEVEHHFGFPIGGVAPIGYEASIPVVVDEELLEGHGEWVYTGVGSNSKTLRLSRTAFLKLMAKNLKFPLTGEDEAEDVGQIT